MKKVLSIILVLVLAFSFTACGNTNNVQSSVGDNNISETVQNTGETQSFGNIKLMVPSGWIVIPGDAGGVENDNALFLKESEDKAEYLWIKIVDEANAQSSLEYNSEDDIAPFAVNGIEWIGKSNMITATIDGKVWLVSTYGYAGFESETVRTVIGSLQAA